MIFPANLLYTKEHEWLRLEGEVGTIGITDYAQGELGDVVFLELPSVGKLLKKGDVFGSVEAVKAVSDLYAPVSGEVVDVNAALDKTPEIVNYDPFASGWMLKIKLNNPDEVKGLLSEKGYRALVGR